MSRSVDCLSPYVEVCLRALGGRKSFPSIRDPDRERLSAKVYGAISRIGWPADLSGVLEIQRSAERRLDKGTFEGTETSAALLAIEIACSMRLAAEPVQSKGDASAKLAWLQAEMHLAAADEKWVDALDDVKRWLCSEKSG